MGLLNDFIFFDDWLDRQSQGALHPRLRHKQGGGGPGQEKTAPSLSI
jgi:hypothetical protein